MVWIDATRDVGWNMTDPFSPMMEGTSTTWRTPIASKACVQTLAHRYSKDHSV